MQKSAFDIYLAKVAAGDLTFLSKVGEQLVERLCFLPILKMSKENQCTTVQAVMIERDDRFLVPVFTSEARFKEWSTFTEHKGDVLPLLGGELCAVLGLQGVLIDPLTDFSVELSAEFVQEIGTLRVESGGYDVEEVGIDAFSRKPPGKSAQSQYEESLPEETFPHEGTPESFNPRGRDPVTATMVTDTEALESVIQGGDTEEFDFEGMRPTEVVTQDPLLKRKSNPRNEKEKEKKKTIVLRLLPIS